MLQIAKKRINNKLQQTSYNRTKANNITYIISITCLMKCSTIVNNTIQTQYKQKNGWYQGNFF